MATVAQAECILCVFPFIVQPYEMKMKRQTFAHPISRKPLFCSGAQRCNETKSDNLGSKLVCRSYSMCPAASTVVIILLIPEFKFPAKMEMTFFQILTIG